MNENDLWQALCQEETIEACEEYLRLFPQGQHVQDVNNKIKILKGCNNMHTMFLKRYIKQGIISIEALINAGLDEKRLRILDPDIDNKLRERVEQKEKEREQQEKVIRQQQEDELSQNREQANFIIQQLRDNPNAFYANELQGYINNRVICHDDLVKVFGEQKTNAILSFSEPSRLPEGFAPQELSPNSTEVFFWGTPSSGKTCALGGIISNAGNNGIMEKLQCNGYDYMTRLSNIFDSHGFCTFPDSTSVETIQDMMMRLTDKKNKTHRVTLVDLAGELFRSVYFKRHELFLEENKAAILETAMSYLRDTRNKKIHFFVVEYGAHDKEWEGLRMKDYLSDMVGFLEEENVFKKSTVGVYVLVTKCDLICGPRNDRPRLAYEYVEKELASFWNPLERVCKRNGVGDLKVISYSVGDVFAQKLCKFDASDTEKVIDKLLTKTPAEGGWTEWLKG